MQCTASSPLVAVLDLVTQPDKPLLQELEPVPAAQYDMLRAVFEDENIVGAGVTKKVTAAKVVDQLSITFYVREKLPRSRLSAQNLVPPVVAGLDGAAVFTDVFEIGEVVPQINCIASPIMSGYSVGHASVKAGTVGAIVRRGTSRYLLSNSHVLANSGLGKVGDAILYPGREDGGKIEKNTIAILSEFKPFEVGDYFTNRLDAALAEIRSEHVGAIEPALPGAATPVSVTDPAMGMKVLKRGRTTGDTESEIRDVHFRILVRYENVGVVGFTGQVLCAPFTDGGDSGAIVIDKSTGAVVGLHFAGSSKGSIFTPMRTVMSELRFEF